MQSYGACYFPPDMAAFEEHKIVLRLVDLFYEGKSGLVGPINVEIRKGDYRTLTLENGSDALALVQVMKGVAPPKKGKVIKNGRDVTGQIVQDGCIALVETERFFSVTIRDEISFSAQVGESKNRVAMAPYLDTLLDLSGLATGIDQKIAGVSRASQEILALVSALLMLPDLLILVDPMRDASADQRDRYFRLVSFGQSSSEMAILQVGGEKIASSFISIPKGKALNVNDSSPDQTRGF